MNNIRDRILLKTLTKEGKSVSKKKITEKATTVWLEEELLEKVRDYAYTERISVKQTIHRALEEFLKGKELLHRPAES